jgi:hypothetical protein
MMNGSNGIVSRFSFTIHMPAKFAAIGSVFSKLPPPPWPRPECRRRASCLPTQPGTRRP